MRAAGVDHSDGDGRLVVGDRPTPRAPRPGDLAHLVRLVGDGRLRPALDTVLPLEQAGAAAARARTDVVGKVVPTL
ncbi:zinc-binding dehydrogenase [Aquipuribacter sp. SD81]|uniref:zinc-binding dehydrogenase n=1 Tax=Aquipuribacter sp. SD81 TaxID=3127703 RepID=UPI00301B3D11